MTRKFRYPTATIVFMALSLLGCVLIIANGYAIATHVPVGTPPFGALGHLHYSFAITFLYGLLLCDALGLIVWGVLFAIRRAGVHRMAEVQTWPK